MVEVHPASGGDWGSCNIDEAIERLFREIFTSKFIENLCEDPDIHMDMKHKIQQIKLEIDDEFDQEIGPSL